MIDADQKIQYRRIVTGPLQEDGLRVVTQGLKADDTVLVGGLQQVRPQMQIRPEFSDMPTLGSPPPAAAVATQDTKHAGAVER